MAKVQQVPELSEDAKQRIRDAETDTRADLLDGQSLCPGD